MVDHFERKHNMCSTWILYHIYRVNDSITSLINIINILWNLHNHIIDSLTEDSMNQKK